MPANRKLAASTAKPDASKPVVVNKPARKLAGALAKPDAATAPAPVVAPVPAAPEAAAMPRGLVRDAAGVVRYATNYDRYSDRDQAYLAFFGNVARRSNNVATLRAIHDAGVTRGDNKAKRYNPNYIGSAKATDVGAINRLCKAGYFTRSADGNTLTATAVALSSKAYCGTSNKPLP